MYAGKSRAEVAALVGRLADAAGAAEKYALKARLWATERDRLAAELVRAVSASQDSVQIDHMELTVERPAGAGGTSTPSL